DGGRQAGIAVATQELRGLLSVGPEIEAQSHGAPGLVRIGREGDRCGTTVLRGRELLTGRKKRAIRPVVVRLVGQERAQDGVAQARNVDIDKTAALLPSPACREAVPGDRSRCRKRDSVWLWPFRLGPDCPTGLKKRL